jgi:hypothetical protein
MKEIFSTLSQRIHTASIVKDDDGRVIVPFDLPPATKRFFIRFLIASGEEAIILKANGCLRKPHDHEIFTPESSPPSSEEKKPRKRSHLESSSSSSAQAPPNPIKKTSKRQK